MSPLTRDYDCPAGAVYLDSNTYWNGYDSVATIKDAACVFEYRWVHGNCSEYYSHCLYTVANSYVAMTSVTLQNKPALLTVNYGLIR